MPTDQDLDALRHQWRLADQQAPWRHAKDLPSSAKLVSMLAWRTGWSWQAKQFTDHDRCVYQTWIRNDYDGWRVWADLQRVSSGARTWQVQWLVNTWYIYDVQLMEKPVFYRAWQNARGADIRETILESQRRSLIVRDASEWFEELRARQRYAGSYLTAGRKTRRDKDARRPEQRSDGADATRRAEPAQNQQHLFEHR